MIDLNEHYATNQAQAQATSALQFAREREMQVRVSALQLAAQIYGGSGDGEATLTAARSFEAFITGADGKAH